MIEMTNEPDKIILMGLGASGKSSITSIIFEGKKPDDVEGYHATVQYARKPVSIVKDIQILDCGGQDSFITAFLGEEKSEFIFSDLNVLLWIVDISDSQNVSTSKYYFDTAINHVCKYSPQASVYVFLHKMDLIKEEFKIKLFSGLSEYFRVDDKKVNIQFFATSIYDQSLYKCFSMVIQELVKSGAKSSSVSDEIKTFLQKNEEFYAIAAFSEEGLAVFEEGEHIDELTLPSNLSLDFFDQIQSRIGSQKTMVSLLELDNYFYYFKRIHENFILAGLSNKLLNIELGKQLFQSLEVLVLRLFE